MKIYLAYCHACDLGWASRSVHEAERRSRSHVMKGLLKSIVAGHVVDVFEVETEEKVALGGQRE